MTRKDRMLQAARIVGAGLISWQIAGAALAQGQARPPAAQPQAAQQPAAQQPAAQPAVASEPEATVSTFGDWALRCVRLAPNALTPGAPAAAQPVQACEVTQTLQAQGQNAPFAQLAIGRVARNEPLKLTVVLPNNISFPSHVRLQAGETRDAASIDMEWRRCVPGGCFADAEPSAALLTRLRSAGDAAQMQFKDAAGRDATVRISLRGLAQALDALPR